MKLHPRHQVVAQAALEMSTAMLDTIKRHKLTYGEAAVVLARLLQDHA